MYLQSVYIYKSTIVNSYAGIMWIMWSNPSHKKQQSSSSPLKNPKALWCDILR